MTSSKITAMATLALALVLIGSIVTGHLFVVYALLPNTPVIDYQKIQIQQPPPLILLLLKQALLIQQGF
jgi:hypothetical protein